MGGRLIGVHFHGPEKVARTQRRKKRGQIKLGEGGRGETSSLTYAIN